MSKKSLSDLLSNPDVLKAISYLRYYFLISRAARWGGSVSEKYGYFLSLSKPKKDLSQSGILESLSKICVYPKRGAGLHA